MIREQVFVILGLWIGLGAMPAWADTMYVESWYNDGPNTFRAAVAASNTTTGVDTIRFATSNTITVYQTITITDPVIIEGGWNTIGAMGYTGCTLLNLQSGSGGSVIRNLILNRANQLLGINSEYNRVTGCIIGTNYSGATGLGAYVGVQLSSGNNWIGGTTPLERNVISGNIENGINVFGAGNTISGNYIGTDPAGMAAVPNYDAVYIGTSYNLIGGFDAGAGNVIAGNNGTGLTFGGHNNQLIGNYFNINSSGTAALPGGGTNLLAINNNFSLIANNYIAGPLPIGSGCMGNTLVGNFVGVLPNGNPTGITISNGIVFGSGAKGNMIGLRETGQGNFIANVTGYAIYLDGATTVNNGLFGNTMVAFGTRAIGLANSANGSKAKPIIAIAVVGSSILGTAEVNDYVEVFKASKAGSNPATWRFIGYAITVSDGTWHLNPGSSCQAGEYVCATATNDLNNTSEVSDGVMVVVPTPTSTSTPTYTRTTTFTMSPTATKTSTATHTPTATCTPTFTASPTCTESPTITLTCTSSATLTSSPTSSVTPTQTSTATASATLTRTPTRTITVTLSITPTVTRSTTITPTLLPSSTATRVLMPMNRDELILYPMPARGETLWFAYLLDEPATVAINIYNVSGELCKTLLDEKTAIGMNRTTCSLNAMAPGIYLYQARIKTGSSTRELKPGKFVVIKGRW